jgi:regulator of RNase E activity RraA
VGYAATARLRTDDPPIDGIRYQDRTDWWKNILEVPAPRVVVLKDTDKRPGVGAFLGDTHASILQALGCIGYVTNGAVRKLEPIHRMKFQLFAGNLSVSHAYAHIFDFGSTVDLGGMLIRPGDLLHGDRHGILSVPKEIAADIPAVAARLLELEQKIIQFCQSDGFSLNELCERIRELDYKIGKL